MPSGTRPRSSRRHDVPFARDRVRAARQRSGPACAPLRKADSAREALRRQHRVRPRCVRSVGGREEPGEGDAFQGAQGRDAAFPRDGRGREAGSCGDTRARRVRLRGRRRRHFPATARRTMKKRFEGRPASPGIAMGSLVPMTSVASARIASGAAHTEAAALRSAIAAALADLRQLADRSDDEAAGILAFQVALLEDDELAAGAFAAIAQGRAAHDAWLEALGAEAANYKSSEDEYFR